MSKIVDLIHKISDNADKRMYNIEMKLYNTLPVPLLVKRIIINFINWIWFTILPVVSLFILIFISSLFLNILSEYIIIPENFLKYLLLILILSIFSIIFYSFAKTKIRGIEDDVIAPSTDVNLEHRITRIAESLKDSTKSLNEISQEIEARKELVAKLQAEIEAANLKTPEINAVAQLLRNVLIKERKSTFWQNMVVGFIFFMLGLVASMYFGD
jgi:hypothetical protein